MASFAAAPSLRGPAVGEASCLAVTWAIAGQLHQQPVVPWGRGSVDGRAWMSGAGSGRAWMTGGLRHPTDQVDESISPDTEEARAASEDAIALDLGEQPPYAPLDPPVARILESLHVHPESLWVPPAVELEAQVSEMDQDEVEQWLSHGEHPLPAPFGGRVTNSQWDSADDIVQAMERAWQSDVESFEEIDIEWDDIAPVAVPLGVPPDSERPGMLMHTKRTYKPSNLVRKRRHGFRARLNSIGGRRVIKNRISKGRKKISA